MLLLSKAFFMFVDQLNCVIEVFYIVPPILFWDVANPGNKIFNGKIFSSFDCPFVEQIVNFKKFKIINITINKHKKGLMVVGLLKKIFR